MLVQMGQVKIAQQGVLESQIGTCVSLCLFHRESGLGGMTHISRSRSNDQTPSGRLLRHEGYHYADAAIPKLLE
ncbi:MAG: hypothetical protein OEX00_11685, partial [Gammaproteobacteria bacterium]|nr:hypothetical protein [Gammaproteobacteria bacterium]